MQYVPQFIIHFSNALLLLISSLGCSFFVPKRFPLYLELSLRLLIGLACGIVRVLVLRATCAHFFALFFSFRCNPQADNAPDKPPLQNPWAPAAWGRPHAIYGERELCEPFVSAHIQWVCVCECVFAIRIAIHNSFSRSQYVCCLMFFLMFFVFQQVKCQQDFAIFGRQKVLRFVFQIFLIFQVFRDFCFLFSVGAFVVDVVVVRLILARRMRHTFWASVSR